MTAVPARNPENIPDLPDTPVPAKSAPLVRARRGLIGRFIDLPALTEAALAEARFVLERHDLPQLDGRVWYRDEKGQVSHAPPGMEGEELRLWAKGKSGPVHLTADERASVADLDDRHPWLFRLRNATRLAGRMLVDDLVSGSESAALPLLLAAAPLLPAAAMLLSLVLGGFGAFLSVVVFAAYLIAVARVAGVRWMGAVLFLGGLPSLASYVLLSLFFGGVDAHMAVAQTLQPVFTSPIMPIVLVVGLLFFQPWKSGRVLFAAQIGLVLLAEFAVFALFFKISPSMTPVAGLVLPAALPYLLAESLRADRAAALAIQGAAAQAESGGGTLLQHTPARIVQAERAINGHKKNPLTVAIGTALNVFAAKRDGFAVDPGGEVVLDLDAIFEHVFVFGRTGSGKTSGLARVVTLNLMRAKQRIGIFLTDGKGSEPGEYRHIPTFQLVQPNVGSDVAPLAGLRPEEWAGAIADACSALDNMGGGSKDPFFENQGRLLFVYLAVLLDACNRAELKVLEARLARDGNTDMKPRNHPDRQYRITVDAIDRMLAEVEDTSIMDQHLNFVTQMLPAEVDGQTLLNKAVRFLSHQYRAINEKTRTSILASPQGWVARLMTQEGTLRWCFLEEGDPGTVDVTDTLYGAWIGVCLPESLYGSAGKVFSSLLSLRVINAVRRRAQAGWSLESSGETPIVMVGDEIQETALKAHIELVAVARSLKCGMVFMTQQADALVARFGADLGKLFASQFNSWVSYASSELTRKWFEERLGMIERVEYRHNSLGVDFRWTAENLVEGPMYDPSHPDYKRYKAWRRQGAGRSRLLTQGNLRGNMVHDRGPGGRVLGADGDLAAQTSMGAVTQMESKRDHLLTPPEWSAYTSIPFTAVAQVVRGGVIRRAVMVTHPIFFSGRPPAPDSSETMTPEEAEVAQASGVTVTFLDVEDTDEFVIIDDLTDVQKGPEKLEKAA